MKLHFISTTIKKYLDEDTVSIRNYLLYKNSMSNTFLFLIGLDITNPIYILAPNGEVPKEEYDST